MKTNPITTNGTAPTLADMTNTVRAVRISYRDKRGKPLPMGEYLEEQLGVFAMPLDAKITDIDRATRERFPDATHNSAHNPLDGHWMAGTL